MADTARLRLPLLEAGQAQKHITVNEALARLDLFTSATALSRSMSTPPAEAPEGALYVVPEGAGGDWAGHAGELAGRIGGGWIFAPLEQGRSLWIMDEGRALAPETPGFVDVDVAPGASFLTPELIADKALVHAVSARVIKAIEAPGATGWRIGVEGASGRYGGGYGLTLNAWAVGLTGQPQAYYRPTRLLIEAEGGSFVSGRIRFAIHAARFAPPPPV